jgi:hypothetical protein
LTAAAGWLTARTAALIVAAVVLSSGCGPAAPDPCPSGGLFNGACWHSGDLHPHAAAS